LLLVHRLGLGVPIVAHALVRHRLMLLLLLLVWQRLALRRGVCLHNGALRATHSASIGRSSKALRLAVAIRLRLSAHAHAPAHRGLTLALALVVRVGRGLHGRERRLAHRRACPLAHALAVGGAVTVDVAELLGSVPSRCALHTAHAPTHAPTHSSAHASAHCTGWTLSGCLGLTIRGGLLARRLLLLLVAVLMRSWRGGSSGGVGQTQQVVEGTHGLLLLLLLLLHALCLHTLCLHTLCLHALLLTKTLQLALRGTSHAHSLELASRLVGLTQTAHTTVHGTRVLVVGRRSTGSSVRGAIGSVGALGRTGEGELEQRGLLLVLLLLLGSLQLLQALLLPL